MEKLVIKILVLLLSYIIGSIPFGFIIGKLKGIDIRKVGSHNIGATNTGRALGKKYAVLTFILDTFKGALFVVLFRYNIINNEYMVLSPALYGLLATLGHAFPIFLKFKGGKSVATGAGLIFGYIPILIPVALLCFYIVLKLTHVSALGSLISSVLLTIISITLTILGKDYCTDVNIDIYFAFATIITTVIVFLKHIPNIKRLIKGTENKV